MLLLLQLNHQSAIQVFQISEVLFDLKMIAGVLMLKFNTCMLANFFILLLTADFFQNLILHKILSGHYIRLSKSLDPD